VTQKKNTLAHEKTRLPCDFPTKTGEETEVSARHYPGDCEEELRKNIDWKYTDNSAVVTNVSSTGTITSLLANLIRGDAGKDNFGGTL